MQPHFVGIIPARYASTRFPGKPLVDIGGQTMIQRVYSQATKVLNTVLVATDDERIYNTVEKFGGKAIMTRNDHVCGTDRCLEAFQIWKSRQTCPLDDTDYVVINIQGDEPFIQPSQIEALEQCFSEPQPTPHGNQPSYTPTEIATLVKPYTEDDSLSDLENPNTPKVIFSDLDHRAILFSRSVIPYLRGIDRKDWLKQHQHYRHIGMYAYRADVLKRITQLPQSVMERNESLEQLRWLENGFLIKVAVCSTYSIGIDTPDDLQRAIAYLKNLS